MWTKQNKWIKRATLIFVLAIVPALLISLPLGAYGGAGDVDAEEDPDREIVVDMHDNYFASEDALEEALEEDEFVIQVEPGEEINFIVRNVGDIHHTFTIYHSPDDREEPLADVGLDGGEEETVTVTMPDEETELYLVCLPHENIDMVGEIVVTAD